MRTILFILTIASMIIPHSDAQNAQQYFDGADTNFYNSIKVVIDTADTNNIWQIGKPQKTIFDSAATFPNAIITDTVNDYPVNNVSRFTIQILNQYGVYGIFALQWKQKLDMDSARDGGIVEYTTDHGSTWTSVFNSPYVYNFYGYQTTNVDTIGDGELAFTNTDSTWRDIWLCFDISWMTTLPDTLMFRFTFKSDSVDHGREGWMIDNIIAHQTAIHTIINVKQSEYLKVYPNPTSNIVYIEAQKQQEFHIIEHMELINAQGEVVAKWDNLPTKFWFDAGKYGNGVYLLKIKTNLRTETFSIVVKK